MKAKMRPKKTARKQVHKDWIKVLLLVSLSISITLLLFSSDNHLTGAVLGVQPDAVQQDNESIKMGLTDNSSAESANIVNISEEVPVEIIPEDQIIENIKEVIPKRIAKESIENKTSETIIVENINGESSINVSDSKLTAENLNVQVSITSCTDITTAGRYTIDQDINSTVTKATFGCIQVNSSNVYLDGLGHYLQGNQSANVYGINHGTGATYTNLTITNFNIFNFTRAIYSSFNDVSVLNNTINFTGSSVGGAQFYSGSTRQIVDGNTFYLGTGTSTYALDLQGSSSATVKNNYFFSSVDCGSCAIVYLPTINTLFSDNNINFKNTIQYGVYQGNNQNTANVTISNNTLVFNGSVSNNPLFFGGAADATAGNRLLFFGNYIREKASASEVYFDRQTGNLTIRNNTFYNASIYVHGHNFTFSDNFMYGTLSWTYQIKIANIDTGVMRNNNITGSDSSTAVYLEDARSVLIENNSFIELASGAALRALSFHQTSGKESRNNTLLNNLFKRTGRLGYLILDFTPFSNYSYLVYNNSLGDFRWVNASGFLTNMNLTNASGEATFGLGTGLGLEILNQTVAFNTSHYVNGTAGYREVNDSAQITLYSNYNGTTKIYIIDNYTTNSSDIKNKGRDCVTSGECFLILNTSTAIVFNTTHLSSYYVESQVTPTVSFTSPSETNNSNLSRNFIQVNISISDDNYANSTIYLYNSSIRLINSTTSANNPYFQNFTVLADGGYYFNATAIDNDNLSGSSSTINVTIDTTNPLLTISSPINNTNYSVQQVNFTFIATDTTNTNCTIYFNGTKNSTNSSIHSGESTFFTVSNIPEGRHYWNITCVDSLNFTNSTENRNITVDTTNPLLTISSPINNTNYSAQQANFTFTVNDTTNVNCTIYLNGTKNSTNSSLVSGESSMFTISNIAEGRHYWNITCVDSLNFTNSTENRDITVDTTNPLLTISSPINNTNYSVQQVNFTFIATDTTNTNCTIYFNGTKNSTNSSIHSGESTFFTVSNIPEGRHYWNITCIDAINFTNSTENRNITVDLTAPTISSLSTTPADGYGIDPSTEVNFTVAVTDNLLSINSIILEYYNGSVWQNKSMVLVSGNTYNTNITTQSSSSNYTYRVYANDSVNNNNRSSNQTFESMYDCAWNISTSSFGATGGYDENKNIGNVTITNTGDSQFSNGNCGLQFRVTYDLTQGRIYYDTETIKSLNTYSISASNNQSIQMNGTFLTEVNEEAVTITINEVSGKSNLSQKNISATLVTTVGGPYLYESITSYPTSTIYLTPGNYSLQGYIRNIVGDGTAANSAYNASFNWSLPTGFSVISGNAKVNYTNISNNSLTYNNINITFNSTNLPDLSSGTATIYLYAQGYNSSGSIITHSSNRTTLSESVALTLQCYNVSDSITISSCGSLDGDYVAATTTVTNTVTSSSSGGGGGSSAGGGGGGGALTKEQKEKLFQTTETYEIVRGEEGKFLLKIENPFNGDLVDVKVSLTGFLSQYLKLKNNIIPIIKKSTSRDVEITIEAPEYFSNEQYELNFVITGTINEITKVGGYEKITPTAMKDNRLIKLVIQEISSEKAGGLLAEIKDLISKMQEKSLNVDTINSLLSSAVTNYNTHSFSEVKSIYEQAQQNSQEGLSSYELLSEVRGFITKAGKRGISIPDTERLFFLAKSAFDRGDYTTSLKRIDEAKTTYALETVGKFNLWYFLKDHWPIVSVSSLGSLLLIYLIFLFIKYNLISNKLRKMVKEEKIILGLIKEAQKECFSEGKISMEEYVETLIQYEGKLGKIVQDTIRLQTMRSNIFRLFKHKDRLFIEERKKLLDFIKKTQELYMKTGAIETRVYQNRMKSYTTRLSEIEENIADMEAKREMKKRRKR